MNTPAGYQLQIRSWENDGDAPGTEILSGLTQEDVKFYLDLLEHFRSGITMTSGFLIVSKSSILKLL